MDLVLLSSSSLPAVTVAPSTTPVTYAALSALVDALALRIQQLVRFSPQSATFFADVHFYTAALTPPSYCAIVSAVTRARRCYDSVRFML